VLLRVCTPVLCQHEGIDEETGTNAVGSKKGEHNYRLDRDGAIINKCAFYCLLSTPKKVGRPFFEAVTIRLTQKRVKFLCIGKPNTGRWQRSSHVSGGLIQDGNAEGLPCFVSGAPIQMKASGREFERSRTDLEQSETLHFQIGNTLTC